jgi:choline dehydrogenase-like flavoprotein
MGDDRMSVVDRTLRVHGVEGLRVADASIMPAVIRGHTNAAATAIGERAAELVRDGGPPHLLGSWRHGRREAHAVAGTPSRDRDLA